MGSNAQLNFVQNWQFVQQSFALVMEVVRDVTLRDVSSPLRALLGSALPMVVANDAPPSIVSNLHWGVQNIVLRMGAVPDALLRGAPSQLRETLSIVLRMEVVNDAKWVVAVSHLNVALIFVEPMVGVNHVS
eukprot:CAMPEP_0196593600 /NCGR_PEP_ID=MMETSP1081-20130531/76053_1 /TAXON_ID=36882 /ORGANISM="Pyramimonas amylifera, Strain CCMP720" /LENGTH=131 /DNA_ID=CAMNT_0041917627 /DNA_START=925 /DNA_END=1320 /DNA_ORIENTATION=+